MTIRGKNFGTEEAALMMANSYLSGVARARAGAVRTHVDTDRGQFTGMRPRKNTRMQRGKWHFLPLVPARLIIVIVMSRTEIQPDIERGLDGKCWDISF